MNSQKPVKQEMEVLKDKNVEVTIEDFPIEVTFKQEEIYDSMEECNFYVDVKVEEHSIVVDIKKEAELASSHSCLIESHTSPNNSPGIYMNISQEQTHLSIQNEKHFDSLIKLVKNPKTHIWERLYQCSHCDKCFNTKPPVNVHQKKHHTGEKLYQCSTCGKYFNQMELLEEHQKVHSGYKPYQCNHCDKCFSSKFCLVEHMNIHTGEKPYQCSQCDKAYTRSSHLKRHLKKHTEKKQHQHKQNDKVFISEWLYSKI